MHDIFPPVLKWNSSNSLLPDKQAVCSITDFTDSSENRDLIGWVFDSISTKFTK